MTALDRLIDAVRKIIRAEVPALTFAGLYSYTVQSASGATVEASPTDTTLGLPPISGLTLSPSILGELVTGAQVGAVAYVQFVNGDPTRPVVVSLSLPSTTATIDATALALGPGASLVQLAGGTAPVARQGDAVTIYLDPVPASVNGTVGGVPFIGTIVFAGPATGIIVAGNPRCKA